MRICHSHNLDAGQHNNARNYGLRLSLPAGDTFASVLGPNWSAERWYCSDGEREAALLDITGKHRFSRIGDQPTYVVERIGRAPDGTIQSGKHNAAP